MSRFTEYCEWIVTARKCLDGEPPPGHLAKFRLGRLVQFPLRGIEPSRRVAQFYQELLGEIEQSRLDDTRKRLYRKFTRRVVAAHVAVEEVKVPIGTVSNLRKALARLSAALNLIITLKDYDDEHPVHWSEVFPTESMPLKSSPDRLWHDFKLESIRPCLVCLVRILRLVLPDFTDMWDECEASLTGKQWILLFVLDSPKSQKRSTSPRLLKGSDLLAVRADMPT
ncbi:hypothetical protein GGS23DRAFT_177573 [Durotheca rogersii]|uniref:uncharacterized protein n=1 Tax=Durotheca rogersii TaxID=419775 RepID=UPI00221E7521|nr:uncharacterized protein GGS23DRAFT_177573 [Durotheca rogersii]KAI5867430.1 hypothetical protein GGS23DRAFT_177573 [Durotheca rogersii]